MSFNFNFDKLCRYIFQKKFIFALIIGLIFIYKEYNNIFIFAIIIGLSAYFILRCFDDYGILDKTRNIFGKILNKFKEIKKDKKEVKYIYDNLNKNNWETYRECIEQNNEFYLKTMVDNNNLDGKLYNYIIKQYIENKNKKIKNYIDKLDKMLLEKEVNNEK